MWGKLFPPHWGGVWKEAEAGLLSRKFVDSLSRNSTFFVHNWEILLQNAQGNHNKHFRKLCEIVTTKANVKRKQTVNYVGSEKVGRRKLIPISVPPLEVGQKICPTLIGSGANDRIACLIAILSIIFVSHAFSAVPDLQTVGKWAILDRNMGRGSLLLLSLTFCCFATSFYGSCR